MQGGENVANAINYKFEKWKRKVWKRKVFAKIATRSISIIFVAIADRRYMMNDLQ